MYFKYSRFSLLVSGIQTSENRQGVYYNMQTPHCIGDISLPIQATLCRALYSIRARIARGCISRKRHTVSAIFYCKIKLLSEKREGAYYNIRANAPQHRPFFMTTDPLRGNDNLAYCFPKPATNMIHPTNERTMNTGTICVHIICGERHTYAYMIAVPNILAI